MKRPSKQPAEQLSSRPGEQSQMKQKPISNNPDYKGSGKLAGKVTLVTGGDSGIGRAICIAFAKEGALIANVFLKEHTDAKQTQKMVEAEGGSYIGWAGDVGDEKFCKKVVKEVVKKYGRLDILVNNAAEQHPQSEITDITQKQLEKTFRTNIFSIFFMIKAALPYLKAGSSIINTTSVTAYKGSPELLDYSSSKGAIVALTRSLSQTLVDKKIRVNAVAPGPIWTPLIPSTFAKDKVKKFGSDVPMARAGQPEEVAPSFVFLASDDSSYITGQVLHPNGGTVVNG